MHYLLLGILLGLGAAIPIGPINLEMIRRNLRYGTPYGIMLGLGACAADVTYLVLLCLGVLVLLQFPLLLTIFNFIGALILIWFAVGAFRSDAKESRQRLAKPSLLRYSLEGYMMTLFNPFTILFWASISSQISLTALTSHHALFFAGVGVMIGTAGWVLTLNTVLHFTRHKLTTKMIKMLNYLGGVILIAFALRGIINAVM